MSSLASQVVLHPLVSQSIKVWATTLGRDKVSKGTSKQPYAPAENRFVRFGETYRAVQYFARFLAWYLIGRGYAVEGARWNNLKASLASGRKLMRLFKPMEHLQAALRATQLAATAPEQITTIGRQLGYAGYLTYDMLVWAHAIRFITFSPERATKVNKTSLRFWLAGILFSIAHGILKAGRLANEAKALRRPSTEKSSLGDDAAKRGRLSVIATQREATRYQLLLDILDVWLPASGLGLVNFNDGLLGVLGFTTSVMALRTQWAAITSK